MVNGGNNNAPSEAALCRGSSQIAISRPSYAAAHNSAAQAADKAATAEMTAATAATAAGVTDERFHR